MVNKKASEIRAMNVDDRAILWGKDRTLEIGANDKFVKGIATPKWNNNYSNGGTPHDSYNVDIDFFLFRVAEAYLNAAEAEMHLNGESSAKAKKYIDALRNRAHARPRASYTLNDVLDERARELYCEGLRRTDLIRFNQLVAVRLHTIGNLRVVVLMVQPSPRPIMYILSHLQRFFLTRT